MGIEEFFIEKYKEIELENTRLKNINETLSELIKSFRLQYNPTTDDIRATRWVRGEEEMKNIVWSLSASHIPFVGFEQFASREENKKSQNEKIAPNKIKLRDALSVIKHRLKETDEQIGYRLGASQTAVTGWRNGKTIPRKEMRAKIVALWDMVKTEEEKDYIVIN